MTRIDLTDAQIHERASDYALRHRVSYAEAVQCVASHAQAVATMQAASFSEGGAASDAQIDARARAFAIEHRVDYADALAHVVSFSENTPLPAPSERLADLDDAQIDAHARAYMGRHRVGYAEAVQRVVSFAETGAPGQAAPRCALSFAAPSGAMSSGTVPAASAAPVAAPAPVPVPTRPPMTDAELDAAARAHAARHGVDYVQALQAVLQERGPVQEVPDSALPDEVSEDDRRLDRAALAYVRAMGVSYGEALAQVIVQVQSDFAEGAATASHSVAALQGQYIEIFRAGTHTDSAGQRTTFSPQDVRAIAASYDPARGAAPLTLGHPDTNGPGYGRVKALQATEDGRLLMLADQIDPAFADSVKAGRYRKRSASFYPPRAPGNPSPGQWYLRHVGWLGAQPPAVAGLADVKFSTAAQDGALCFADHG